MSKFLFVSLVLIGFSAQAQTKVGDWVSYKIQSITEFGEIRKGVETVKVLKLKDDLVYIQTIVVEAGPYRSNQKTWVSAEDLMDAKVGKQYVEKCGSEEVGGGVADRLTVPAGTFAVCKIADPSGNQIDWYGAVPFGLVKSFEATQWDRPGGQDVKVRLFKELMDFGTTKKTPRP